MRDLLIYLAILYQGDYGKMTIAIKRGDTYEKSVIEEELAKLKSSVVTILDHNYPRLLRDLKNPPYVLFYYGDLNLTNKNCISMIGMRRCSEYGRNMATYFSSQLKEDFVIVSGLAKGIDALCHQNSKKTIAVLGCGIDYCYPKENKELYEYIKKEGLVLSEYPYRTPPKPYYFPWRNRIVAALSLGIVVIEANKKSGTMITVSHGLELGRMIFAVPGRITDATGTIGLIQDGAFCLESVQDIYEVLNLKKNS